MMRIYDVLKIETKLGPKYLESKWSVVFLYLYLIKCKNAILFYGREKKKREKSPTDVRAYCGLNFIADLLLEIWNLCVHSSHELGLVSWNCYSCNLTLSYLILSCRILSCRILSYLIVSNLISSMCGITWTQLVCVTSSRATHPVPDRLESCA